MHVVFQGTRYLFIYFWFYVAFNTVQVISRRGGGGGPVHSVC